MAGRAREADQRRHRAGGAADHDVLRGRPLQPPRVDEHVEEVPGEREQRGRQVDERVEQDERERRQRQAELERARGGTRPDATGRCSVREPISCRCRGRDSGSAPRRRRRRAPGRASSPERAQRREAARADEKAGCAGEQQQRHDPRLRQRDVVAPRPLHDGPRNGTPQNTLAANASDANVEVHGRPVRSAASPNNTSARPRQEQPPGRDPRVATSAATAASATPRARDAPCPSRRRRRRPRGRSRRPRRAQ